MLSDLDISIITMLSGVINSVVSNPIWFVNTRMSLSKEEKSFFQTVKEIYNTEGLRSFYKGVLPNILLVANPIINFVIYENLKKSMLLNKYSLNAIQLFLISAFSKTIATIATYPIMTIKVQLQSMHGRRQLNIVRQILKIAEEMGFKGLFNGFYTKLVSTVIYNGFLMLTYEKLKRFIKYLLILYVFKRKIAKQLP